MNRVHINSILESGLQTLNGEEALAYARNRHAFRLGDVARGEHQMEILEAIIKKASSPSIIKSYSKLIDALQGRVITNMSVNEMYKFAKMQIKKNIDWQIESVSATGTNALKKCYSTGNLNVAVIESNAKSIDEIKKRINSLKSK